MTYSLFSVSSPAADRNLLSVDEMKDALGISDPASSAGLMTLGLQISDMVARECNVPGDGMTPPTLRKETISQTFRQVSAVNPLMLSRRFVAAITSIVEDGVTLSTADYELDRAAGMLTRLDSGGGVICWDACKIVVTYDAGFETVPEPLKLAAVNALREQWSSKERDPLIRSETIDGIGRTDYWVNAAGGASDACASPLSAITASMLDPYRYWPG